MACSRNGFRLVLTCLLLTGTVCGEEECGLIQDSGFRIIGGTDAEEGQYPFVVRIAAADRLCAGALIDSTHVLTVTRCLSTQTSSSSPTTTVDPADVTVFVGSTSRFKGEAHNVASVLVHDNYDYFNLYNNIAILTLSEPVTDEPLARSVCLNENTTVEPGKECRVLGWGFQEARDKASYSETLQVGVDSMLDRTECISLYRNAFDGFFCGTGGVSNPCFGDGGAPYVCEKSGHWYLYGLASSYISGAACTSPARYTKVSYYSKWIQDNTNVY